MENIESAYKKLLQPPADLIACDYISAIFLKSDN